MVKSLLKFAYGALFTVLVPLLLVLWAEALDGVFALPVAPWNVLGVWMTGAGILLMIAAMAALRIYGKGLPMNAFPPKFYVRQNVYRLTPHPIYCGFSLTAFGVALVMQSPAGFWIVAPVATLASVALTLGYERLAIRSLYGIQSEQTLLRLPQDSPQKPDASDYLSALFLTGLPWFFAYEAALFWGKHFGGFDLSFAFEYMLPVWQSTTILYSFTYIFVGLTPFILRKKSSLRRFMVAGNLATLTGILVFFTFPVIMTPRPFTAEGMFGDLLLWERAMDGASAAFPSFHAVWAVLAGRILAQEFPRFRGVLSFFALALCASCITAGMHSIADVLAGIILALLCFSYKKIWQSMLEIAEKIANSWREWHFGAVRVINHGFYAGLATFLGAAGVSVMSGGREHIGILFVVLSAMVGAALWAQIVEGSPSLLRPFGYYGAIFGGIFACILWGIFGGNAWQLCAGFAVFAPLIQSVGRLRCLVQGCCHGAENAESLGIHVRHPRSRICRLSDLGGKNIYPTQVYSIVWNLLISPILFRLWFAGISPMCIIGCYLLLSSIGRFVEEGYRGEPQTHSWGGLRLYQWLSVGFAVSGAFLTTLPMHFSTPVPAFSAEGIGIAFVLGCAAWFALGVDFPHSSKRFSRLT